MGAGQGLGQQVNAGGYSRPAVNYDFCGIFHRRPVLDQFCGGAHSAPVVGYGLPEVVHRAGNAARDAGRMGSTSPRALWRAGIQSTQQSAWSLSVACTLAGHDPSCFRDGRK